MSGVLIGLLLLPQLSQGISQTVPQPQTKEMEEVVGRWRMIIGSTPCSFFSGCTSPGSGQGAGVGPPSLSFLSRLHAHEGVGCCLWEQVPDWEQRGTSRMGYCSRVGKAEGLSHFAPQPNSVTLNGTHLCRDTPGCWQQEGRVPGCQRQYPCDQHRNVPVNRHVDLH